MRQRQKKTKIVYEKPGFLHALLCILAFAVLLGVSAVPAYADSQNGESGWHVLFNGNQMESTFHSQEIADAVYALQPGDDVTFALTTENTSNVTTDWYMTNEVLRSLEDTQAVADNGGYTYRLTYKDKAGTETVLYTSDSIGGEKESPIGEGLNEATDSLEDFFFLDRLAPGEGGSLALYVALDGESQGNVYQDTLADLQMNFAVELVKDTSITPKSKQPKDYPFLPEYKTNVKTIKKQIVNTVSNIIGIGKTHAAKTGDVWTFTSIVLLAAGLIVFTVAFVSGRKRRKHLNA